MRTDIVILAATAIGLFAALPARAIEEPAYTVETTVGGIEIRRYAPYLVAEVLHPGPRERADGEAFRLLFAYISGANNGERKIEMTAPVTREEKPAKIEMTAPVTNESVEGGFLVHFVLPRRFTLETVPQPTDERVRVREIPAQRLAVVRFSGRWTQSNYETHLAALRTAIGEAGLRTTGEPVLSRYDSPFTLPFMRRNEIWLRLE